MNKFPLLTFRGVSAAVELKYFDKGVEAPSYPLVAIRNSVPHFSFFSLGWPMLAPSNLIDARGR